jgi:CheY-like chemotaxis protein
MMILAQMLEANEDKTLNAQQQQWATTIHGAGRDLLALINEILDLSKVEAGRIEAHREAHPIAAISEFAEAMFRPVAIQKGLEYSVEVSEAIPSQVATDHQLLEQILKNLLGNAFKFTERGKVTLRIERAPVGSVFRNDSLREAPAVLAFAISDTGIGIPLEKWEAVFEAFQQADTSITRKYGGTGLGLTISREYARILGGEIGLESTPGVGSTFTLYLPLAGDLPPAGESESAEPAVSVVPADLSRLEGKRILIVEDDVRNLYAITSFLERCKAIPIPVTSAAEAFSRLREHPDVALILMDIMMPDTDGLEATRRIRMMAGYERLPIIAHTAKASESDREQCLAAGCTDYVAKPADIRELGSLLVRHLRD